MLESYWNGDSTVVALVVKLEADAYGLQLWTMGNYHWYMKQFIPFEKGIVPLWVVWDPVESFR